LVSEKGKATAPALKEFFERKRVRSRYEETLPRAAVSRSGQHVAILGHGARDGVGRLEVGPTPTEYRPASQAAPSENTPVEWTLTQQHGLQSVPW
jgi:hypothetical protein